MDTYDTAPSLVLQYDAETAVFLPGQTLRLTLEIWNPGPTLTRDVYAAVIILDGATTLWLTNVAPLEGVTTSLTADPFTFVPHLRGVNWPAVLHAVQRDYFTYTFTRLELSGTYHFFVGWVNPASL